MMTIQPISYAIDPKKPLLELSNRLILLPFSCQRLVRYLFDNNGCLTMAINRDCAIANVSDVVLKNREKLALLGLTIHCEKVSIINRFGQNISVGSWHLRVVDPGLWFGLEAANDES